MGTSVVRRRHIDVLVQAMLDYGVIQLPGDDFVGEWLWNENYRSVNYRYGEDAPTPSYSFTKPDVDLSPIALHKQVENYEYNSRSHPEWASSEARELCGRLREALVARIGLSEEGIRTSSEWRDAPWGV